MIMPTILIPKECVEYEEFISRVKLQNEFNFLSPGGPINVEYVSSKYMTHDRVAQLMYEVKKTIEDLEKIEKLEKSKEKLDILLQAERIKKESQND